MKPGYIRTKIYSLYKKGYAIDDIITIIEKDYMETADFTTTVLIKVLVEESTDKISMLEKLHRIKEKAWDIAEETFIY